MLGPEATRFVARTIAIALVIFATGFFGIRAWACTGPCNRGFPQQCYGESGDLSCPNSGNNCEHDTCLATDCPNEFNHYNFCVAQAYECRYPSCSWIPYCCDYQ